MALFGQPRERRSVTNIKDYGAVGDGITDDTASINAALNAVVALNGTLYFPSGTYLISDTLTTANHVTLMGQSPENAILKLADLYNWRMWDWTNKDNLSVIDLGFDGNKDNNTLQACLMFQSCMDINFSNCIFNNCGYGIQTYGSVSRINIKGCKFYNSDNISILLGGAMSDVSIADGLFSASSGGGIYVANSTDTAARLSFINNKFINNTSIGLWVNGSGAPYITDVVSVGNISIGNRDNILYAGVHGGVISNNICNDSAGDVAGDGIVIDNCIAIVCNSNTALRNRARGILVLNASQRCIVSNNTVHANNVDEVSGLCGIDIAGTDCLIFGNTITDDITPTQAYGIRESEPLTSARNTYIDNYLYGNTNPGITGVGTTSKGPRATGATSCADGGTIDHGLIIAPNWANVSPSVAGEMATITTLDATHITVAIKKHDGSAGTTQTIYWSAEI